MSLTIWTDGDAIVLSGAWPLSTIEARALRAHLRATPRAQWREAARAWLDARALRARAEHNEEADHDLA